jgi:hypothetical protein
METVQLGTLYGCCTIVGLLLQGEPQLVLNLLTYGCNK